MHEVALDLLILLGGIWLVAVTLRPLGLPTVMGELIVGVVVGPAVLGLIEPNDAIQLLADIGIFFLMFHAGIETQPSEFFDAVKRSLGVAIVGAIVPFVTAFGVATAFGLDAVAATFVGLTMTATAVVITLKSLKDLGLSNTRLARVVIASAVIDDLLTLVFFGLVIGVLSGGGFEPMSVVVTLAKLVFFFGVSGFVGIFVYPRLTLPFRSEGGKGFTFVLFTAIAAGLFADAIGLHMILGAYLAGLFFEEKVAHPNLVRIVHDRAYGIAYSFLGPIFFISLGFSITFDISASGVLFLVLLTVLVIIGQVLSAGGMALRMGLPKWEAVTVGVGMCGRAELAFIVASLALAQGAFDQSIFSALIFTAFALNLFTPLALKGCAVMLEGGAARRMGASRGVLQIDKFDEPLLDGIGELPQSIPDVEDAVVVYRHGPEVEFLLDELEIRGVPSLVLEEDEDVARQLHESGQRVVYGSIAEDRMDYARLVGARALVANGDDDRDALFALSAREHGFTGPIVAMIENPLRRAAVTLAGATEVFTPKHALAAVIAARASARLRPRLTGAESLLGRQLEVAELRLHENGPLANRSLAESAVRTKTGAHIVGRWLDDGLRSAPAPDERLESGTILVAAGSPESIIKLSDLARPITEAGRLVLVRDGEVGHKLAEILTDAGEDICVVDPVGSQGVEVVGDPLDQTVLERAAVSDARAVVLALGSDDVTLLTARFVRDYAPDVPIIAAMSQTENVDRVLRAGADFALSVSQVAGQILVRRVLGETVSIQPRIKLVKTRPGPLAGRALLDTRIREQTGCSVIAVERSGQLLMDFSPTLKLADDDALYVCGTAEAVGRFFEDFPAARL